MSVNEIYEKEVETFEDFILVFKTIQNFDIKSPYPRSFMKFLIEEENKELIRNFLKEDLGKIELYFFQYTCDDNYTDREAFF